MIEFFLNQNKYAQLEVSLEESGPRMLANIAEALQAQVLAGAERSSSSPYWAYGVTTGRIRDTGDALHTRSGTLQRSIEASPDVEVGGSYVLARWGAATPYARIQEMGGYAGRGGRSYIPARPYLRPVIDSMRAEIAEAIQLAIIQTLIEQGLTS